MVLFVTGLTPDMDDIDLKEMFELYGEVASARVVLDKMTKKSRGFGFVEMPNKEEALEAINLLDGVGLGRKVMSVQESEERKPGFGGNSGNRDNFNRNFGNRDNRGGDRNDRGGGDRNNRGNWRDRNDRNDRGDRGNRGNWRDNDDRRY
ncbi:RNA-binding protein [Danxiaibacter flavus]|uniref:RNA-binding protein n=1 Tax=Danxiaibacter flavus TaxID=3049108 RepID=A0ABV3ZHS6_9BACT|nr:RNA-binding protein [Chitinophagaceae bacterium DXS]